MPVCHEIVLLKSIKTKFSAGYYGRSRGRSRSPAEIFLGNYQTSTTTIVQMTPQGKQQAQNGSIEGGERGVFWSIFVEYCAPGIRVQWAYFKQGRQELLSLAQGPENSYYCTNHVWNLLPLSTESTNFSFGGRLYNQWEKNSTGP